MAGVFNNNFDIRRLIEHGLHELNEKRKLRDLCVKDSLTGGFKYLSFVCIAE